MLELLMLLLHISVYLHGGYISPRHCSEIRWNLTYTGLVSSSQVSATGDLYVAHFDFADNAEHGRIASDPAEASEKPKRIARHLSVSIYGIPSGWRLPECWHLGCAEHGWRG